MVRRVGFGDEDRSPREEPKDAPQSTPPSKGGGKGGTRFVVGAFLSVWLLGWSAGIAAAINEIIEQGLGAADTFLFVWVAFASIFWVIAVVMLWRSLTGRPISNSRRRNWGRTPQERGGVRRGDWDHGAND